MIELQFDFSELEAKALALAAVPDQIPYIMALALNDAAQKSRSRMIDEWPAHVTARNSSFIGASLTTKGTRATKGNLTVEVYDKLENRLGLLGTGGTRAARGGNVAIPSGNVRLTSRGVSGAQKPRALKNAFRKGDVIYQRVKQGRGKKAITRLKLMYVLRPTTAIPKQMPFYELFAETMRTELNASLPAAVAKAMATRRVR